MKLKLNLIGTQTNSWMNERSMQRKLYETHSRRWNGSLGGTSTQRLWEINEHRMKLAVIVRQGAEWSLEWRGLE